jgi:hypothetical protein
MDDHGDPLAARTIALRLQMALTDLDTVGPAARFKLDTGWGSVTVPDGMTTREKLHILVDELTDGEAEAALARLSRERELLRQWTGSTDTAVAEDEWALANAREAIREERW